MAGAEEEEEEERGAAAAAAEAAGAESAPPAAEPAAKKKKKKKKKKAAGGADGVEAPDSPGAGSPAANVPDEDAEVRFTSMLEGILSNDEDLVWASLSGCGITDKKVKRVGSALKDNTSVTSVDLSRNSIGDAGAQAIAAALALGAAPNLLSLDLSNNRLTEKGHTALEGLRKLRKSLQVDTGPKEQPQEALVPAPAPEAPPPPPPSPSSAGAGSAPGGGITAGGMPPRPRSAGAGVSSGMMQYFREEGDEEFGADDDLDDEAGTGGDRSGMDEGPAPSGEELVTSAFEAARACASEDELDASSLGRALFAVLAAIDEEMRDFTGAPLEALPPLFHALFAGLSTLVGVLDMEPPKLLVGRSRDTPVRASGTHRVAAVEILARLVQVGCVDIDTAVAESGAVPVAVALMFDLPWSNALHNAVVRLVQVTVASPVEALWVGLVEGDRPLPERLAGVLSDARDTPVGKRLGIVGPAIVLANTLKEVDDEDDLLHGLLRDWLAASDAWVALTAEDGALAALQAQQAEPLCGPKPQREPTLGMMGGGGGGMGGGNGMSGLDLLAMLQNISRMYSQNPGAGSGADGGEG